MLYRVTLVLLVAAATRAIAQDPTPGADLPTDANSPASTRQSGLVGIPVLTSSPQLGTGAGAVGAVIFHMDSISRPSAVGAGGVYSTSGSWMLAVGGRVHFQDGAWRALAGLAVYDVHYDFFGVGSAAGDANNSVPIKQRGNADVLELLHRVVNPLYAGLRYRYNNLDTKLDGGNISGPLADQALSQPSTYSTSALGWGGEYDTRNEQVSPSHGIWGRLTGMYARDWLGSDQSYNYYDGWVNQYIPVNNQSVLALRVSGCAVGDAAPIWEMCLFGVHSDLRGYRGGQYRDRAMFATQAEYRMPIYDRFTGALFVGVGEVASSWSSFASDNLLVSGGPGVRYLVSPSYRLKVGADYAFAKHGGAFYFRVGEAF
jgi:surface antigen Omp85-like protein